MLKIRGRFAVNRDVLTGAGVNKLKIHGMKSNASNQLLSCFLPMIFSVADNRVAQRRKLRTNLILQSRFQLNPDERSIREKTFDGVSKFGTGGFGVSRRAQLLIHSITSKVMYQRPCLSIETAAYHRKILSYRSVLKKLPHQRVSIRTGLRKQ
jgi:hypothetical protein